MIFLAFKLNFKSTLYSSYVEKVFLMSKTFLVEAVAQLEIRQKRPSKSNGA